MLKIINTTLRSYGHAVQRQYRGITQSNPLPLFLRCTSKDKIPVTTNKPLDCTIGKSLAVFWARKVQNEILLSCWQMHSIFMNNSHYCNRSLMLGGVGSKVIVIFLSHVDLDDSQAKPDILRQKRSQNFNKINSEYSGCSPTHADLRRQTDGQTYIEFETYIRFRQNKNRLACTQYQKNNSLTLGRFPGRCVCSPNAIGILSSTQIASCSRFTSSRQPELYNFHN